MKRPLGPTDANWRALTLLALACALALGGCGGGGGGTGDGEATDFGVVGPESATPDEDAAAEPASFDASTAPEEDADRRGPRLNSIFPNSGPLAGGTPIRVVGTGFLEGTVVHIGERECGDVVIANENHIDCTTPPGFAPGPVSVTLRWSVGGVPERSEGAFTYYVPVAVTGVTPDRGPARGGTEIAIDGDGFIEGTEVRFGPTLARATFVDEHRLTVLVPAGEPGPVDLTVRNAFGEVRVAAGYTYFEDLVVLGLEPRWGSTAGGTEVGLRGAGLVLGGTVQFGDAEATLVRSELERTRLVVTSPPGRAGLVPVAVDNVNGAWRGVDAFLYIDEAATDFAVIGVVPSRVAAAGGDTFEVGGAGFDATATVTVDGVPVVCTLTNPHILRCEAPPHPAGAVDVVVEQGGERRVAEGALTFFEKVDIYTVRPNRGAVAGGTLVEVRGEGFTEDMNLTLDGEPLGVVEFVDSGTLWAVTPPGRPGLVAVGAQTTEDQVLLPEAFEYFNPASRFGGVWGDPINGAVNATVLDAYSGDPIVDATVITMPAPGEEPRPDEGIIVGTTDVQGQVVLSDKVVGPPQNVTACAVDYECGTIERQTSENVTLYLVPHNPPSGGGGGGGDPIPNSRLAGTVSGLGDLAKPLDPYVLLAFVDTTHSSPYNRRVNLPAEPNGVLSEDGPFEIMVKPGEMAAIVTAGIVLSEDFDRYRSGAMGYWEFHETMFPVAMGFQRFISLSPGEGLEGLELVIDKPMDVDVPVTQVNPPVGGDSPYVFEAWPFLDFGAEGFWEIDSKGFGETPDMTVTHLPDIRGWDLDIQYQWILWGHSGEQLQVRLPYTVTTEKVRDITAGLRVDPVASLALVDRPSDGVPLGPERRIEWHWADGVTGEPTTPPDATVLTIDSADGLPLWTYVAPGGITEVELPRLPEDVQPGGLVQDTMILTIVPFIGERPLNYGDFTYEELGYWARHSYSATTVTFEP